MKKPIFSKSCFWGFFWGFLKIKKDGKMRFWSKKKIKKKTEKRKKNGTKKTGIATTHNRYVLKKFRFFLGKKGVPLCIEDREITVFCNLQFTDFTFGPKKWSVFNSWNLRFAAGINVFEKAPKKRRS
jgi:hypothetical protein